MEMNLDWLLDKFIAHKGFHNETIPENSLPAFANAIENGYAIELDVRMLADKNIAVFHDKELGKTTGQDGYISMLTTEDLVNYKLNGTEEHIPTLREALDLIAGQTPVVIDIKVESSHIGVLESELYNIIKDYDGRIAVMSFNPLTIEWFKKNAPEIPRGLLSTKWDKKVPADEKPDTWVKRFVTSHNILRKRADPHFLAYNVLHLPSRQVKKFKGITLLGWVVKSQEQYLDKVQLVDNIIFEGFEPKI